MTATETLEVTPMVAMTATAKLPLTIGYIVSGSDGEIDNRREVRWWQWRWWWQPQGTETELVGDSDTDIDSAAYYFRDSSSDGGVDFGITWTMMCKASLLQDWQKLRLLQWLWLWQW